MEKISDNQKIKDFINGVTLFDAELKCEEMERLTGKPWGLSAHKRGGLMLVEDE